MKIPDAETLQSEIVRPVIATPIFFNTLKNFETWRVGVYVYIEVPHKDPVQYSLFDIHGDNVDLDRFKESTHEKAEVLKENPSKKSTRSIEGVYGGGIRTDSGVIIATSGFHEGLDEAVALAIAVKYFGMSKKEIDELIQEHLDSGTRNRYLEMVLEDLELAH